MDGTETNHQNVVASPDVFILDVVPHSNMLTSGAHILGEE